MEEVDQELVTREEILKQLKHNLEQAQNWMKQSADVHRREETYNIGSMVWLPPEVEFIVSDSVFLELLWAYQVYQSFSY